MNVHAVLLLADDSVPSVASLWIGIIVGGIIIISALVGLTWRIAGIKQDGAMTAQRVDTLEKGYDSLNKEQDASRGRHDDVNRTLSLIGSSVARLEEGQRHNTQMQKEALAELRALRGERRKKGADDSQEESH